MCVSNRDINHEFTYYCTVEHQSSTYRSDMIYLLNKFQVRDWVDRIVRDWPFKRIIPAHFAAPVNAGRSEFLTAFVFLDELLDERFVTRPSLSLLFASFMGKASSFFPPDDMKTLSSLDQFLVSVGAVKKTVSGRKR